jgi:hypothetical protein
MTTRARRGRSRYFPGLPDRRAFLLMLSVVAVQGRRRALCCGRAWNTCDWDLPRTLVAETHSNNWPPSGPRPSALDPVVEIVPEGPA